MSDAASSPNLPESPAHFMDVMRRRRSCRSCEKTPIAAGLRASLEQALQRHTAGPFGSTGRFTLLAAAEDDTKALKGFGTYGFVRNPAGFILGAVPRGPRDLEDFGYLMELQILEATALGLGTCWLGGTFTRSRFAEHLQVGDDLMPAVVSVGYASDRRGLFDRIVRRNVEGDRRLPWADLFFDTELGAPLDRVHAAEHADALEMVRLAPSASNHQPWRVVRCGRRWDFYLKRTAGYRERNRMLFGVDDLQRVDVGIAMSHFELSCRELGLPGAWVEHKVPPSTGAEYVVSFES